MSSGLVRSVWYKKYSLRSLVVFSLALALPAMAQQITITSTDGDVTTITFGDPPNAVPAERSASPVGGPAEVHHADEMLNRVYEQVRAKLDADAFALLRKEQREWITDRDTECGISYKGPDREKWLGHVISDEKRALCFIRTTQERTSVLLRQLREFSGVNVSTGSRMTGGKTPRELIRDYWTWSRGFPSSRSAAADETGRLCAQGQAGPVWFLTGSTSSHSVLRRCEIPSDVSLVIPALNVLVKPLNGVIASCEELQSNRQMMDTVAVDRFTIDGVDFRSALQRIDTGCFELNDVSWGVSGPAFGDGLWAILDPLPPGEHTIAIGGRFPDGFSQDVTYKLIVRTRCELPVAPGEAEVIAVGRYRGLSAESIQLGESGNKTRSSTVVVNRPDKAIVLVLMAYDPTWWKVALTPGTRLKGVILAGYHTQAITGISRNVPLIKAVYEEKGTCPYFYAYKAGRELDQALKRIETITGQSPAALVTEPDGGRFVIGSPSFDESRLIWSEDYTIEDFPVKLGLPAGRSGIDYLVREGKLRPATRADIEQWVESAGTKYRKLNPSLKVSHYMSLGSTYVVLGPVTLPTGLYGGHSVSLLIPEGVPKPKDPGSHNGYYYLENGVCHGAVCPRD